ncbi:MAG TPA: competence protein CoiA family protein [Bacteroidales bacterium]|nr:competence protein CoiA family protein [Bacteroidales bacterium]HPI86541.1 competence protein CoiA family protein [Bacteroidales bacterium]HPM92055.1 competence protein CoiA family protein [Bacteroidales bacterium]
MKYALVDNNKTEATKGVTGICPGCGSELIAKCGDIKLHHWAHKGNRKCDPWWENETPWHRSWKNNFQSEWQEVILCDEQTGEKHIADIRTTHGLVIEFQHSHINPQERTSRENFYKNMVWVVDGTRLESDYKRLDKGKNNFRKTNTKGLYLVSFPEECFPSNWLKSSVPIIFDFRGTELNIDMNDMRNSLFCLYPKRLGQKSILVTMAHDFFIKNIIKGEWQILMNNVSQFQQAWQKVLDLQQRQQTNFVFDKLGSAIRYKNRRRRF